MALTLAGMIVAGTLAYGKTDSKTIANDKAITDHKETVSTNIGALKKDGCDPSRQAKTDVAVIKSKLDTISEKQESMRIENKKAFEKILEKF